MSPRERTLAMVIAVLAVGFGGYMLVVVPVTNAFARVADETTEMEGKLQSARLLVDNQRRIDGRWVGYRQAGLRDDEFDARRRTQESIAQWCDTSRLTIKTMEPSREPKLDEDERFAEITIRLTAEGSIGALQRFLQHVSAAPFPLRVESCTISNRREGEEALTLVMSLSTIIEADPGHDESGGA